MIIVISATGKSSEPIADSSLPKGYRHSSHAISARDWGIRQCHLAEIKGHIIKSIAAYPLAGEKFD